MPFLIKFNIFIRAVIFINDTLLYDAFLRGIFKQILVFCNFYNTSLSYASFHINCPLNMYVLAFDTSHNMNTPSKQVISILIYKCKCECVRVEGERNDSTVHILTEATTMYAALGGGVRCVMNATRILSKCTHNPSTEELSSTCT